MSTKQLIPANIIYYYTVHFLTLTCCKCLLSDHECKVLAYLSDSFGPERIFKCSRDLHETYLAWSHQGSPVCEWWPHRGWISWGFPCAPAPCRPSTAAVRWLDLRDKKRENVRWLHHENHCNYPRDYVSIYLVKWASFSKNVPERLRFCHDFVQVSMLSASNCYNSIQSRHCFGSTMSLMTWLPATFNPSLNRTHRPACCNQSFWLPGSRQFPMGRVSVHPGPEMFLGLPLDHGKNSQLQQLTHQLLLNDTSRHTSTILLFH